MATSKLQVPSCKALQGAATILRRSCRLHKLLVLTLKVDRQSLEGLLLPRVHTRFRLRAAALLCKLPLGPRRYLPDLAQRFPEISGFSIHIFRLVRDERFAMADL